MVQAQPLPVGGCVPEERVVTATCPLRHAGVYTAEEVALITREKLIRLQSLYIDQFKRLQHLLKEKKRRYLSSRKAEHDSLGKAAAAAVATPLAPAGFLQRLFVCQGAACSPDQKACR